MTGSRRNEEPLTARVGRGSESVEELGWEAIESEEERGLYGGREGPCASGLGRRAAGE